MSQRVSGYERKERDLYETPEWVTKAIVPYLEGSVRAGDLVVEPACGSGKIVKVLRQVWPLAEVWGSDIEPLGDFQTADFLGPTPRFNVDAAKLIITNPPYDLAQEFIERALGLCPEAVTVMLLRIDFDSAKTRRHLFADSPFWSQKVVLTDRIRWFNGDSSPSFNHAWYIWRPFNKGTATIAYASKAKSQSSLFEAA